MSINERDELADLIWDLAIRHLGVATSSSKSMADELLAAGYRKPRTITTVEELDALPEGTTIVDQAERLTLEETSIQHLEWVDRHGNACHVELPATVLHEPEAAL